MSLMAVSLMQAVRKAENVLGKEKQQLVRDFAPDKKVRQAVGCH